MQPIYDSIGSTYCATRRADPGIARELARLVGVKDASCFLDVACGTGNYTCALADFGGHWFGVDVSEVMLKQAAAEDPGIRWTLASADNLPFQDRSFDGATCCLAIHHFPELASAFREVWRVLDNGRFILFTALPDQMCEYWLSHYFPEMMRRSAQKMPSRQNTVAALQSVGFVVEDLIPFHVSDQLQDLFLYSGKQRPEAYLDPTVRANISSFALLCTDEELNEGLRALQADLNSGTFDSVVKCYSSSAGDYAYVVARK